MEKSLIIVESPAKARTLKRYLGKKFDVMASVGHVRDLPKSKFGVDCDKNFEPQYVTIKGKGPIVKQLTAAAKKADVVFLAPDPDREGEAIAWHLAHYLEKTGTPLKRALFHELTKKAILQAIDSAGTIDNSRFEAQQARRILDRLVGYKISPLLWDKVRRGLSAGRVQSVALRMICEREAEVGAFEPEEYWSMDVELKGKNPPPFTAALQKIKGKKAKVTDEKQASKIKKDLEKGAFIVSGVTKKERKRRPLPPFITSTMQQDAVRKLRFTAKRTMAMAQKLYEGVDIGSSGPTGLITYMRTDSTRVSSDAIDQARKHISQAYGSDFLPAKPVVYKSSKSAQDAHEAIRPTDATLTPEKVAPHLDKSSLALYTLIWQRFVASQMRPAVYDQTTIEVTNNDYLFRTVGSILRFPGFLKVYSIAASDNGKETNAKDVEVPDLRENETLTCLKILPEQHFTQPPPRFNEASLVKALEENGVGRPSTYAAIISTLQDKEYTQLDKRVFFPTELGKAVNELLVAHFPDIINVKFTAGMEQNLDQVENGDAVWRTVIKDFYGPFAVTMEKATKEMASLKSQAIATDITCPSCDGTMVIKWGRNGEFLACENYPDCRETSDFKRDEDGKVVKVEREAPKESDETCEKCGKPMVYKKGRFGTFLACSGYPECKNIRAETTGVNCPEKDCSGELIKKVSRRGKVFYGCNRYPDCSHAVWNKPVTGKCPDCGHPFMVEKITKKKGTFLQCPVKECGYQNTGDGGGTPDTGKTKVKTKPKAKKTKTRRQSS